MVVEGNLTLYLGTGEGEECPKNDFDDDDDCVLPRDGVEDLDDILNEDWIPFSSLVFGMAYQIFLGSYQLNLEFKGAYQN